MRVPIYVHSENLTSPSVYPFLGYFDVLCVGEHATVRCSGNIGQDGSPQDAYFASRYIEEKIRKIISITISQEEVDDFFYHFWTGFIHSDLSLDDEIRDCETNDNIAMFVAWQPLPHSVPEDKEHRLEIPICVSGIGLLQLFATPYVETNTATDKNKMVTEWAPIVQMPHPFFRPLGKPDKAIGYLSIQTPLAGLGYTTLYSNRILYSKIATMLSERNWNCLEEQRILDRRLGKIMNS